MLNNIRKFSKTFFAKIIIGIIIIPFVFWGMGGVFSGGNTNNIAKINNNSISTEDFIEYLNSINIDLENIKVNIDNNIIEENLATLISSKMLEMEINDLNLSVSDEFLSKLIKNNENFQNEDKKFSRVKYEKFLLTSNMTAPEFEFKLKQRELKKNLFYYISGSLNPPIFFVNKIFKEQKKELNIEYFNLKNLYKKKDDITEQEIIEFIDKNKDKLLEKFITFNYSKITPKNLIGIDDFNSLFFEKIDELEDQIANGESLESIKKKYQLKILIEKNFKLSDENIENSFFKEIYANEKLNKIELLDKNEFYVIYEITNIEKLLPKNNDKNFTSKIKENLVNESKFKFNRDLVNNINQNKFTQINFNELLKKSLSEINRTKIKSINDHDLFSIESVKYLYSLPKNKFAIVADDELNIYLTKIKDVFFKNISSDSGDYSEYEIKAYDKMIDGIYNSYDIYLNKKYKVKINEKTLERVKNYFQ